MEKLIDNHPRNGSCCFDTDLLYKKGNIYLMDNHRMAAWCWVNEIDDNEKYTVIHIDRHYDTLGNQIKQWTGPIINGLKSLTLSEYDSIDYQKDIKRFKIFRWDNYIPIFHHYYSNTVTGYKFYTHNRGHIPENLKEYITHYSSSDLINNFYVLFCKSEQRLIINLDIDYFFSESPKSRIVFSDAEIKTIIKAVMELASDRNNVLTIAISPECCGGWEKSLNFIRKYFSEYGISAD